MLADVHKIIEICLFPEIGERILAGKIENQDDRWNEPARHQGQKILERDLSLDEPDCQQEQTNGDPDPNCRLLKIEGEPAQHADPERRTEREILPPCTDK